MVLVLKNPPAQTGDKRPRFHPWVGKIPWRRAWHPLQYFCLENPMDRGAWQATVHGVAKNWTWLKQLSAQATRITRGRDTKVFSVCREEALWGHSQKVAVYKLAREGSSEAKFAVNLNMNFQPPDLWENKCLLNLSEPACGILLQQTKLTDTLTHTFIYIKKYSI